MSEGGGRELREAAAGPLAARLPRRYLDEHCVLPLALTPDGELLAAVGGPLHPTVSDELARLFGRPLRLLEVPAGEIQAAILAVRREADEGGEPGPDQRPGEDEEPDELRALANQAPVIQLVNALLLDAMRTQASDVHVEPSPAGPRVRFRLDGVLQEVSRLDRQYQHAVVSRIKIMSGLNVAERRLPQDGRARIRLAEREVDLRVSTLPALHGESVVLRVLDQGVTARDLPELGMQDSARERFERLLRRRSGIVLATGPTGSGKTTTLYGALARVNQPGVKIVTVEDPVEYRIEGVTQIPVNRKAGLTFASALRSILRHDPDVIMIGEMRDRETAEIAIQAALTGHLVFSTLHTEDAAGAITRLVDMGIEPYLVAATVQGIVGQRLVRVLCAGCGGAGCELCARTGFRGRTGLFEVLPVSEPLRTAIVARSPLDRLREQAALEGMVDLLHDGLRKVEEGITTTEEVRRVMTGEGPA